MSTQRPDFPPIPFSATYPHQHFRLIELPVELVSVIETGGSRLYFKSGNAPASELNGNTKGITGIGGGIGSGTSKSTQESEKEGLLHLCADEKIWAVRQVSTSNSVYVAQTQILGIPGRRGEEEREKDS